MRAGWSILAAALSLVPEPARAVDYELLAQDLEVMRSIIVASFREGKLGPMVMRNSCQAFYLEGFGAVFTVELWALVEPTPPAPVAKDKSRGWGLGQQEPAASSAASEAGSSQQLLEQLLRRANARPEQYKRVRELARQRFIDLLARHGGSIRQLGPRESVVLVGLQNTAVEGDPLRVQASALKLDLDAVRKGELSTEAFRSKVRVTEY